MKFSATDLCYMRDYEDPCLQHQCPPGFTCYVYQPDCQGCEAEPQCG